jgi:hypothetical protein
MDLMMTDERASALRQPQYVSSMRGTMVSHTACEDPEHQY